MNRDQAAQTAAPTSVRPAGAGPAARARLLVIIPALNEAASIAEVIQRVPRQLEGIRTVDILVVDDGSTDDTARIARDAGARVISHGRNRGLGRAIQTGLGEAVRLGADVAVNIDGDGQFAPEDIPALLIPVLTGEVAMATASRFKDPALEPDMPRVKRLGNAGMAWLISRLTGITYHDVSCGFRAYSRDALLRLVLVGRYTYTQEMFLALAARGLRAVEVPLAVRGVREHGKSKVASNILRYAMQTLSIIFGAIRDFRPSVFFNSFFLVLFVPGLALAAFFFGHRFAVGTFTPHLWAGFLSGYLLGASLFVFAIGQIAGMLNRARILQEEQLYLLRHALFERAHENRSQGSADPDGGEP